MSFKQVVLNTTVAVPHDDRIVEHENQVGRVVLVKSEAGKPAVQHRVTDEQYEILKDGGFIESEVEQKPEPKKPAPKRRKKADAKQDDVAESDDSTEDGSDTDDGELSLD